MERDGFLIAIIISPYYFNSHAHVERDSIFMVNIKVLIDFNSHAHVERDVAVPLDFLVSLLFQLTRSRGA